MSTQRLVPLRTAPRLLPTAAAFALVFALVSLNARSAVALVLDFEGLAEGERVDASALPAGIDITVENRNPDHPDSAIAFDSDCDGGCTGGDTDLRTPGAGGGNDTAQGRLMIIAEDAVDVAPADGIVDDPDDEKRGGVVTMTFDDPLPVASLRVIDVDTYEQGGFVEVELEDGGVERRPLAPLGDNSAQTIVFEDAPLAVALRISLAGSAGIDDIVLEDGATTTLPPTSTTTTTTTLETTTTTSAETTTTTTPVETTTTTTPVETTTTTTPVETTTTTTGETTTTTVPGPSCGDGNLDPGEECDDGNLSDYDACPTTCQEAECGDGFVHLPLEECDDGNDVAGDGCSPQCTLDGVCVADVDGDGEVTATDARIVLMRSVNPLVRCPMAACDRDSSGTINVTDALATLQLALDIPGPEVCIRPVLVVFRLFDAVEIGAIRFAVDYSGVPAEPDGSGAGVFCSSFVEGALVAFNDDEEDQQLRVAFAAVPGVTGPLDLASCVFIRGGVASPLEMEVETIETAAPDETRIEDVTVVAEVPFCGDGAVQGDEVCDDGNDVAGDGCSPACEADGECAEGSAPQCVGPVTIWFRLLDDVTLGALQFEVRYDGLPGAFAGEGEDVECTSLVEGAEVSFGHHVDVGELRAAMAIVEGIDGPTDLATCTFVRTGAGPLGFKIATTDASTPDVEPVANVTVAAEQR